MRSPGSGCCSSAGTGSASRNAVAATLRSSSARETIGWLCWLAQAPRRLCQLRAAIVMHWDSLHRQVRVEGRITRVAAAESDSYFATRNWQSRLGAWASQQSQPIASRAELLRKVAATALRLALPAPTDEQHPDPGLRIARPPHWGGFRLWAEAVELWVEGSARIHDRARWQRTLTAQGEAFAGGPWSVTRLQP